MGPREFFEKHPQLYRLALFCPISCAGYALVSMRRAGDARRARRYAALAALTSVQAVGFVRLRPSSQRRGSARRDAS
jgi:hypothetical protein